MAIEVWNKDGLLIGVYKDVQAAIDFLNIHPDHSMTLTSPTFDGEVHGTVTPILPVSPEVVPDTQEM